MKIDQNAPAFPVQYSNESDGPTIMPTTGLTIRAALAAREADGAKVLLASHLVRIDGICKTVRVEWGKAGKEMLSPLVTFDGTIADMFRAIEQAKESVVGSVETNLVNTAVLSIRHAAPSVAAREPAPGLHMSQHDMNVTPIAQAVAVPDDVATARLIDHLRKEKDDAEQRAYIHFQCEEEQGRMYEELRHAIGVPDGVPHEEAVKIAATRAQMFASEISIGDRVRIIGRDGVFTVERVYRVSSKKVVGRKAVLAGVDEHFFLSWLRIVEKADAAMLAAAKPAGGG